MHCTRLFSRTKCGCEVHLDCVWEEIGATSRDMCKLLMHGLETRSLISHDNDNCNAKPSWCAKRTSSTALLKLKKLSGSLASSLAYLGSITMTGVSIASGEHGQRWDANAILAGKWRLPLAVVMRKTALVAV